MIPSALCCIRDKNYKLVSVGWFFIGLTSFGNA